ncbi:hypothetical protein B0T14DRAFT_204185 [Immersiella caudata]|uniref:Uncharacterized protein n=1 Tax=Immersiella caudata TaxID=314043 RepID=A0AA40BZJ0_9PEZI|nr:hypothetical protein B0T14DRAFT_204185 [Immersiella caudata]
MVVSRALISLSQSDKWTRHHARATLPWCHQRRGRSGAGAGSPLGPIQHGCDWPVEQRNLREYPARAVRAGRLMVIGRRILPGAEWASEKCRDGRRRISITAHSEARDSDLSGGLVRSGAGRPARTSWLTQPKARRQGTSPNPPASCPPKFRRGLSRPLAAGTKFRGRTAAFVEKGKISLITGQLTPNHAHRSSVSRKFAKLARRAEEEKGSSSTAPE